MENEYMNHVAVVGMSGRFPEAETIDRLWENLLEGKNCLQHFTMEELLESGVPQEIAEAENYVGVKGVIDKPNHFDANFFDYTVKEAMLMDPQARVFLEETWKAIEDSGNLPSKFKGRVGVYAGTGMNTYLLRAIQQNVLQSYDDFEIMMGSDKDLLATRVSYKFNLTGPSLTVQSTCSSSLVALHLACQGLLSGDCDMAMTGGVSISYPIKQGYSYRNGMIFSKTGVCRPFEERSDGTVFSDGVGVVVLKRLEDALRDEDAIYGVIRGTAINNDGSNKAGFTAPSPVGQSAVIRDCMDIADILADSIDYVEAHGTGTAIGDPLELQAISKVYGEETEKHNYCAIGSIKSNIGHLNTASGIAGLIKALLILKHKIIPPMANFEKESSSINLEESPFFINKEPVALRKDKLAKVAVSSFGIGGTNAHVILEEAPARQKIGDHKCPQLFPFSAKTQQSLMQTIEQVHKWLNKDHEGTLGEIAQTLQNGREVFDVRKAVVASSEEELKEQLKQVIEEGNIVKSRQRPIYFLITGQGSQYVNMAKDLYEQVSMVREIIDTGVAYIKEKYGENLLDILYPENEKKNEAKALIKETEYAQPTIFMVAYGLGRYLMSMGIQPEKMIGHSLGEFVAACLAGVMTYEEGLDIVYFRGKCLQRAKRGKMLAVKATVEQIEDLALQDVSLSVINGEQSVVIGGSFEAIEDAETILASHAMAYQPLQTSHAFHTPMMEEASERFEKYIEQFQLKAPKIPIISNVTGQVAEAEAMCQATYWKKHIVSPVRFSESLSHLLRGNEGVFIEIGSGKTLIDLATHQNGDKAHDFVAMLPHRYYRQCQYTFFLEQVSKLWALGGAVNFETAFEQKYRKIHMPSYCFSHQELSLLSVQGEKKERDKEAVNQGYIISKEMNREGLTTPYISPRDDVEELLLDLLVENLGVNNVGVVDNFFELGLSSLSASQYALSIKQAIDLEIDVACVIEAGCVAKLSEVIAQELLELAE